MAEVRKRRLPVGTQSFRKIRQNQYLAPYLSDKRKVIGLSIELDNLGKGLLDWEEVYG